MARCEFCRNPVRFWLDAPDRCAFCSAPLDLAVSIIPYDWENPDLARFTLLYQKSKIVGSVCINPYQWRYEDPNMRDRVLIAFYECFLPNSETAREKYRFEDGR